LINAAQVENVKVQLGEHFVPMNNLVECIILNYRKSNYFSLHLVILLSRIEIAINYFD